MECLLGIIAILLCSCNSLHGKSVEVATNCTITGVKPQVSPQDSCRNLTSEQLHNQLMTHLSRQQFHTSHMMLPPMTSFLEHHLAESVNPYPHHIYGDMECPSEISELREGTNLNERSLCPWYYVINHDPDRYPYDLVEAECRCRQSCVGLPPESGTGCEKVYYNVPVLRRTDDCDETGRYVYKEGWHRIAAGCLCAVTRHA